ncbi:MAG: mechanosensitive ion channel family protein [Deltaproteobacteria bacterium]|nr:MAG: mechanosensitive ion channel family protein [Deltaproteobacteria bacterium]
MTLEKFYSLLESLTPQLISYGMRIIGVLFVLWLAFKVANWLQRRITRGLKKKKFDETLSMFFGTLARWLIILGAVLACLGVFGIETTSFAALIGAAGLAVGLAFQGTLSNFSAGIMLLVFRPFKVGDLVNTAGQLGIVKEIGLFVTELDTLDYRHIIVPNSQVASGIIENISANDKRRVDIDVGVVYSADIDQTREVLEKAAKSVPGRDKDEGHQVMLKGLGGSSVDWQVRIWCKTDDYWDVWQATITAVKRELDAAGLGIPFPQMDVHLDGKLDKAA